ncbi:unnamed protein product [Polarella glacialis]|uniref:Uncharacterized protein n=1 Tax=Polarella glacialis TaxID=89957 RepID=A0A813D8A6_POLGL|nr:unnamed protein product [Polarella glacialis]
MPSAFEELCRQRNVDPDEWRNTLASPIIAEKSLLDMTDRELDEHYKRVEDRAENTKEDRALIVLERTQGGKLEQHTMRVFDQNATDGGKLRVELVAEMLEELGHQLSNIELHYLLHKFDCTDKLDMIPEAELSQEQWLWMVGECQILKESYSHVNQAAWEVCYEKHMEKLGLQKASALISDSRTRLMKANDGLQWWWTAGEKAGHATALQPFAWGTQPEVEAELLKQMAALEAEQAAAE